MRFKRTKKSEAVRRRTSVGGERPQAFSYHANRADQEYNLGRAQPREQDVRRREQLVRFWCQRLGVLVAGLVIIFCALDILHLSATPKIVVLSASSNNYFLQSSTVYQRAAATLFASSVFNANKITINTAEIKQKLQAQFPELSDVSITLPLISHRPIVYIAPTTPSLLLATAHSGTFVLDTNGKALIQSSQIAGLDGLKLPMVTDQSGIAIRAGQVAVASTSVQFIQSVVTELAAKGVSLKSLVLPPAAYELDVYPGGAGYYIKFNMHNDNPLQQTGTFLAVQQRLRAQNVTPASYIDVRVDGRAYYK